MQLLTTANHDGARLSDDQVMLIVKLFAVSAEDAANQHLCNAQMASNHLQMYDGHARAAEGEMELAQEEAEKEARIRLFDGPAPSEDDQPNPLLIETASQIQTPSRPARPEHFPLDGQGSQMKGEKSKSEKKKEKKQEKAAKKARHSD